MLVCKLRERERVMDKEINYLVKDADTGRTLAGMFEALETVEEARGAQAYFIEKGFAKNVIIVEYEV